MQISRPVHGTNPNVLVDKIKIIRHHDCLSVSESFYASALLPLVLRLHFSLPRGDKMSQLLIRISTPC